MKPLVYRKSRRRARRQERRPAGKLHITKGDTVLVIRGEAKGRQGKVLHAYPRTGRVVVEGVHIVKRHRKATPTTEAGIVEMPAPIHASNVMLLDPKSGAPTRVRRRVDKDGTVERIAVKSGQPIPRTR